MHLAGGPEPEQASGSLERVKGMLNSKSADTIGVGFHATPEYP